MILVGMEAVRRVMRRHQDVPSRRPRLPLWRLVAGEAWWAVQQLRHEPRVAAALLVGGVVSVAVLDTAAPGPELPWPGRVVVSLLVGLALARGTWAWVQRRTQQVARARRDSAPAVAAAEVVAGIGLVLVAWLVTWSVTLVV